MAKNYVEHRDGGYFVADSRVSLDSVVYAFRRGESPEAIADSWPALTLEQIFGALTFYVANRDLFDRYLRESKREFDALRDRSRQAHPAFYAKLADARIAVQTEME